MANRIFDNGKLGWDSLCHRLWLVYGYNISLNWFTKDNEVHFIIMSVMKTLFFLFCGNQCCNPETHHLILLPFSLNLWLSCMEVRLRWNFQFYLSYMYIVAKIFVEYKWWAQAITSKKINYSHSEMKILTGSMYKQFLRGNSRSSLNIRKKSDNLLHPLIPRCLHRNNALLRT